MGAARCNIDMKWSINLPLVSVFVVATLCIPLAAAAGELVSAHGGQIVFTGAVVEPTCSTEGADVGTASRLQPNLDRLRGRVTCGQTPADAGRSYSRTVASLDTATIASDRLLGYFASYAPVAGGTVGIVIRTYD